MIIGTFTYDAATDTYAGSLATLTLVRHRILVEPHKRSPELDFDYLVRAETPHGTLCVGHAWRIARRRGGVYLDVHIDDPAFAAPIDAALWRSHTGNVAKLQWLRPKRRLLGFTEWHPFKGHRCAA